MLWVHSVINCKTKDFGDDGGRGNLSLMTRTIKSSDSSSPEDNPYGFVFLASTVIQINYGKFVLGKSEHQRIFV